MYSKHSPYKTLPALGLLVGVLLGLLVILGVMAVISARIPEADFGNPEVLMTQLAGQPDNFGQKVLLLLGIVPPLLAVGFTFGGFGLARQRDRKAQMRSARAAASDIVRQAREE